MKNEIWKSTPNLFANGRFRIKHPEYSHLLPFSPYWLYQFTRDQDWDNCTLIARKIEDMTDGELNQWEGRGWKECSREFKISVIQIEVNKVEPISADQLLHLLSIGVYPFDQGHFEDGTVIDSATL